MGWGVGGLNGNLMVQGLSGNLEGWYRGGMITWRDGTGVEGWYRGGMITWRDGTGVEGWYRGGEMVNGWRDGTGVE